MAVSPPAVRMFAPECWGQVDKFRRFWTATYNTNKRDQRAMLGVESHFHKALTLRALAQKLLPNMEIDRKELDARGFSGMPNAKELVTVAEAAVLELYSSIDCLAKVLRCIYTKRTRGFRDSTRFLFENVEKILGIPEEIKTAIQACSWYPRLLHLRDELTHLEVGSLHLDGETRKSRYFHEGLQEGGSMLIINDFFGWFDELVSSINSFLGHIFAVLNQTLDPTKAIFQMCGMVEGRVLHRWLKPEKVITFDNGQCASWNWFDLPEFPTCPFKEHCGAYQNKGPYMPEAKKDNPD